MFRKKPLPQEVIVSQLVDALSKLELIYVGPLSPEELQEHTTANRIKVLAWKPEKLERMLLERLENLNAN